jgi:phasin family protein
MPEAPRNFTSAKSSEENAAKTAERETTKTVGQFAEGQRRMGEAATEQGRRTFETAADTQRRVADSAAEQGGRVLAALSRAGEIYRSAIAATAEDMTALLSSYSVVVRGMQDVQRTWLETVQRSVQSSVRAPQTMIGASDPCEVAQRQHDLMRESMDALLEGNGRLLHQVGKLVEDAARSIEERARH